MLCESCGKDWTYRRGGPKYMYCPYCGAPGHGPLPKYPIQSTREKTTADAVSGSKIEGPAEGLKDPGNEPVNRRGKYVTPAGSEGEIGAINSKSIPLANGVSGHIRHRRA